LDVRNVTIRTASLADLPALREIYRESSLSNDGDRDLLTRRPELLTWSGAALEPGSTRVAMSQARAVGFATLEARDGAGELEDLFVHPAWMRRGVGRALIEDAVTVARSRGWTRIDVDANPEALEFYESVGFEAIGEADLEYGSGVRMRLALDGSAD
jgi:ribosomal protein S18 acetylase RimI-like enzyme